MPSFIAGANAQTQVQSEGQGDPIPTSELLPPLLPPYLLLEDVTAHSSQTHFLNSKKDFFTLLHISQAYADMDAEVWTQYVNAMNAWINHHSIQQSRHIERERSALSQLVNAKSYDYSGIVRAYVNLLTKLYNNRPNHLVTSATAYLNSLNGGTSSAMKSYSNFVQSYAKHLQNNAFLKVDTSQIENLSSLSNSLANENTKDNKKKLLNQYKVFLNEYTKQVQSTVDKDTQSKVLHALATHSRVISKINDDMCPATSNCFEGKPSKKADLSIAQLNRPSLDPNCKESALQHFKALCALRNQYQNLKYDFSTMGGNIEFLAEYRAMRFIDRGSYKPQYKTEDGKPFTHPWEIYDPAPKTWTFWETGNYFREQLSKDLDNRKPWELKLEDLKSLHKATIDIELQGALAGLSYRFPGLRVSAPPGEVRIKGMLSASWQAIVTAKEKKDLENFDIKDENGNPYITFKSYRIRFGKNKGKYKGWITCLPAAQNEEKLQKLIKEINEKMAAYGDPNIPKNDPRIQESPLDFIARVQRTFVSIHPFGEGVGRTSRMIQDILTDKLGLPKIPGGDLQNDIYTTTRDYQLRTRREVSKMMKNLQKCRDQWAEALANGQNEIDGNCQLLYSRKSDKLTDTQAFKAKKGFISRDEILKNIHLKLIQDVCANASTCAKGKEILDWGL